MPPFTSTAACIDSSAFPYTPPWAHTCSDQALLLKSSPLFQETMTFWHSTSIRTYYSKSRSSCPPGTSFATCIGAENFPLHTTSFRIERYDILRVVFVLLVDPSLHSTSPPSTVAVTTPHKKYCRLAPIAFFHTNTFTVLVSAVELVTFLFLVTNGYVGMTQT